MRINYFIYSIVFGLTLTSINLPTFAEVKNQERPQVTNKYPGESRYNAKMRLGYAAMQRKDYKDAAKYFRSALFYNPRDRNATIAFWNARNQINDNISQKNTAYDRYMKIAYQATDKGNYQTALINFRRALQERKNDYYARQAIINVKTYINRGQKPTSANDVNSLPQFYPGETAYNRYMRLGYAAEQREDFTNAIKYFGNALYVNPNDREATIAYWNLKDIIDNGKNTDAQTETKYERQMGLGYDAVEEENYEQALIHFQIALQERKNDYYAMQAIRNVKTYIARGQ